MRIIVTGGFGFIGSSFVNLLKRKNPTTEIVVVDKITYAANPNNIKAKVKLIKKDICDVTVEDLGEYDYLVHFAAESHVDNSITNGRPFIRTNVEGTYNIIECARQNDKLKKFIHISTDEVYGDMDDYPADLINGISKKVVADENFNLKGSSYYSATKAASDLLVESAGRTFNLPYIITRTCNNYGSHQHKEKFIPKIIESIKNGSEIPVYGDGLQVREWIDVEDNVNIIYALMLSSQVNEVFNIGSGERMENIQIIETIGSFLGKTPNFKYVKDRLGHDRRYALNSDKLRNVIGEYIPLSFIEFLKEQISELNKIKEYE
jgi:dTDP-glucose 4,6-dehydratase